MHFSYQPEIDENSKKFKYKTRKEHVRLKILDSGTPFYPENKDFLDNGKVPIYEGYLPTDPLGSYTGKPVNPDDEPVQDVDDL